MNPALRSTQHQTEIVGEYSGSKKEIVLFGLDVVING